MSLLSKEYNSLISQKNNQYVFSFKVPNSQPENLKITVSDDYTSLTVSGEFYEHEENKNNSYIMSHTTTSSFSKTFSLPDDIVKNKPTATLTEGILVIKFNKQPKNTFTVPITTNTIKQINH